MKKLTLLFLGVGLFLYLGESSYAQRGQGAGKAPALGTAQTRSQGRANAGIENANRGASKAEAGQARRHTETKPADRRLRSRAIPIRHDQRRLL